MIDMNLNINIVDLLILLSATWRLSSMLVDEDGIFGMFERLREAFGIRYFDDGTSAVERVIPDEIKGIRRVIGSWLICRWCCSLWVGLSLSILYIIFNTSLFVLPWSISCLSILIDAIISRRYKRRVFFS